MLIKKFKQCFYKYADLLETQPVKTKTISACGLYIAGDYIGQKYILKNEIDLNKTAAGTFVTSGITVLTHFYYAKLNLFIYGGHFISQYASKFRKVSSMLFIDQAIFQPIFNSVFLIGIVGVAERNFYKGCEAWKERFFDTQKASYMLWPAVQFFNYYYVPLQFRILFMNVVGVFWHSLRTALLSPDFEGFNIPKLNINTKKHLKALGRAMEDRINYSIADHAAYFNSNIMVNSGNMY